MSPAARQEANGKADLWDLEAAASAVAAAEEADDAAFTFTYKGGTFTVPPSRRWPARALAAMSDGQLADALPQLLGQQAWDDLCDRGLDLGQLNTLFEKLAAQAGFTSTPNSGPPARRSSTRR